MKFVIKYNEDKCEELINQLKLGKPIGYEKRKAISEKTALKYRTAFGRMDNYFKKKFNELTSIDIDRFRRDLKEDKIRRLDGKIFEQSVKKEMETKFLKMLLKFMGKSELCLFFSAYEDEKEVPSISKDEVEHVIERCKLRDKVIWQLLFDGGFRIEEFINIRFCDIYDDCLISDGYYKIRIIKSKTKKRTIGLTIPLSTEVLKSWLQENKDKIGTQERIIEMSYRHIRLMLKRTSTRFLKKSVYPHLLRHSSATYYCHMLNQYQMCKRFGWSMSSDMPQRYIDREGVDSEEINKTVMKRESESYIKEINRLRETLSLQKEEILNMEKRRSDDIKEVQEKTMNNVILFLKKKKLLS